MKDDGMKWVPMEGRVEDFRRLAKSLHRAAHVLDDAARTIRTMAGDMEAAMDGVMDGVHDGRRGAAQTADERRSLTVEEARWAIAAPLRRLADDLEAGRDG